MLRSASIAVVSLMLLSACPKQAAEKAELEAEIAEAEAALRATTTEQALLKIARHQDARRDVVELYPLRRHTDPVVRAAVTRALGLIGDPDAAGAIAGSLQDRDPRVRSEAAFALSRMPSWRATDLEAGTGPAEAEQWILEALEEELADAPSTGGSVPSSDGVRSSPTPLRAYARALGEIGQKDGAEALWTLVRDTSRAPEVRAEALLALGIQARRGVAEPPLTEEEIAALAPLLIEKKPAVQWPAAYLISRAGVVPEAREKADGVLGIGWKSAEDADVRAWFLRALGKVAGPSAEVILADATSPDRPLRERIGACRGAAAGKLEAVLTRLLEDPEAMIRDEAAAGLGRIGTDETFALLVDRVDHPAALSALAGYLEREGSPATEGRLEVILNAALAATETEDPKLRQAAYGLLGAHPSQSALEALLERVAVADGFTKVTESDPSAALYLAVAISERAEPAVEGALLGWLDGPDSLYGAVAADGLSEREGGHVTTRLAEALERFPGPEEAERRLAIVKALAARENTVTILLKASLDDDGLVREAAADASRKQVGIASSESRTEPRLRDFPELKDGFWGVGDVTGAVLETSRGTITLDLYPGVAPGTVANFVGLAETGYFNGLLFHRVVPDFVIQGGDPLGTGWGGPGHTIRCENSSVDYVRGTLGMALSGKDTGGSQWFITHTPQPHLTGHYTVFGQMTDGWDVLDAVRVGDTIDAVTIVR